uniref:Protein phosphatase 1 regulatory inhibitor subunit 11 n=1 Tax=Sus scrofa TaxID=9823 RepID=A0A8W4FCQ7_PIG
MAEAGAGLSETVTETTVTVTTEPDDLGRKMEKQRGLYFPLKICWDLP